MKIYLEGSVEEIDQFIYGDGVEVEEECDCECVCDKMTPEMKVAKQAIAQWMDDLKEYADNFKKAYGVESQG